MGKWLSIKESIYEISSEGLVRNSNSKRIMKTYYNNNYEYIKLPINGKRINLAIHRTVLSTFSPQENHSLHVNHIDGNSSNNKLENLEWVTIKDNIHHSRKISRNGSVISLKKIRQINTIFPNISKEEFLQKLFENCT